MTAVTTREASDRALVENVLENDLVRCTRDLRRVMMNWE